jgi:hypothetical protein
MRTHLMSRLPFLPHMRVQEEHCIRIRTRSDRGGVLDVDQSHDVDS